MCMSNNAGKPVPGFQSLPGCYGEYFSLHKCPLCAMSTCMTRAHYHLYLLTRSCDCPTQTFISTSSPFPTHCTLLSQSLSSLSTRCLSRPSNVVCAHPGALLRKLPARGPGCRLYARTFQRSDKCCERQHVASGKSVTLKVMLENLGKQAVNDIGLELTLPGTGATVIKRSMIPKSTYETMNGSVVTWSPDRSRAVASTR